MTTPDDLWTHALTLSETATDATQCRCAVSRLYYATFHAVSVLLSFDSSGEHSHQRLLDSLKSKSGPTHIKAAGRLDSLRKARVHADYFLGKVFLRDAVLSARNHAEAVRQLLGIAKPVLEVEALAAAERVTP